ncbi:Flp pilus assembly protein CpaB [Microbacterium sp. SD291]|uniref:Flp pilus assembly protein CpaB n=1 Tax=Microbacterium sp. SD291 TaxID=2782007 RepID=UPI001A956B63|nr:Flp pilus assembly protein CpaB [Microbacterium sp. SD291]MBO0980870.1 Flp pilus assembly protein CpaB [Microbacterium sp. SD291]
MKTRIIGAILALVLAVVGAFVLVSYVRGADLRAQQGAELTEVYVVKEEIPRGTPGEQIKTFVVVDTVPERNLVPEAVTDLTDLEGLLAAANLLPGDQLSAARFVKPADIAESGGVPVPTGMQVLSFTLPADRVVGGEVKAGDRIGMIGTLEPDEAGDAEDIINPISRFAFHGVLVTRVQGVAKPTGDGQEGETVEQDAGSSIMVTIALSAFDAERWVWWAQGEQENEYAEMWLTLENPTTDNSGAAGVSVENAW